MKESVELMLYTWPRKLRGPSPAGPPKTRGGGLGVALVSCRGPGRCGGRRHPPVRGAAVQVRPQAERASPRDRRRLRQRGRVPGAAGVHPGRHSTTHRRRRSGRPERARVGDGVRTRAPPASGHRAPRAPNDGARCGPPPLGRRSGPAFQHHDLRPRRASRLSSWAGGPCSPTHSTLAARGRPALMFRRQGGGPAHHTLTSPVLEALRCTTIGSLDGRGFWPRGRHGLTSRSMRRPARFRRPSSASDHPSTSSCGPRERPTGRS